MCWSKRQGAEICKYLQRSGKVIESGQEKGARSSSWHVDFTGEIVPRMVVQDDVKRPLTPKFDEFLKEPLKLPGVFDARSCSWHTTEHQRKEPQKTDRVVLEMPSEGFEIAPSSQEITKGPFSKFDMKRPSTPKFNDLPLKVVSKPVDSFRKLNVFANGLTDSIEIRLEDFKGKSFEFLVIPIAQQLFDEMQRSKFISEIKSRNQAESYAFTDSNKLLYDFSEQEKMVNGDVKMVCYDLGGGSLLLEVNPSWKKSMTSLVGNDQHNWNEFLS